jgi:hypothetical protein
MIVGCLGLGLSNLLQVDGAEGSRTVLSSNGVVHHTAGNVFELLVTNRFRFVGFFAHIGWVGFFGLVAVILENFLEAFHPLGCLHGYLATSVPTMLSIA